MTRRRTTAYGAPRGGGIQRTSISYDAAQAPAFDALARAYGGNLSRGVQALAEAFARIHRGLAPKATPEELRVATLQAAAETARAAADAALQRADAERAAADAALRHAGDADAEAATLQTSIALLRANNPPGPQTRYRSIQDFLLENEHLAAPGAEAQLLRAAVRFGFNPRDALEEARKHREPPRPPPPPPLDAGGPTFGRATDAYRERERRPPTPNPRDPPGSGAARDRSQEAAP